MPQINFGQAFSGPGKPAHTLTRGEMTPAPGPSPTRQGDASKSGHLPLGPAEWANIVFTIVTVCGGLFCAFYFFNGTDLVRSVTTWPREYLYPPLQAPGAAGSQWPVMTGSFGLSALTADAKGAGGSSPDSFSRTTDPLSLNTPAARPARAGTAGNNPAGSSPPPGSPLSGPGLPDAGRDARAQTSGRSAPGLQRMARSKAPRTAKVARASVRQATEKRVARHTRHLVQDTRTRPAERVARKTSATNSAQQTMKSARQGAADVVHGASPLRPSGPVGIKGGGFGANLRGSGNGLGGHGGISVGGGRGH